MKVCHTQPGWFGSVVGSDAKSGNVYSKQASSSGLGQLFVVGAEAGRAKGALYGARSSYCP